MSHNQPSSGPHNDQSPPTHLGSPAERGGVVDRRVGIDRRDVDSDASGFERRRGRGRRLSDAQKSAEEGEMTPEQFLFLSAINEFKKANQTGFPTWSDVLEVIRLLGYRKTCRSEVDLRNAEDWQEAADAKANVRPARWAERFRKNAA